MHGEAHRRIQQDRRVAAMYRADRIVVAEAGDAAKHDNTGSAVESNGSTFSMIGGCGNSPEKILRTKSSPGIEAIRLVGTTS